MVPTLAGGTSTFSFGAILGAIISFLAVALVVYFVFVVPMNKMRDRAAVKAGVVEEPEDLPSEAELLIQIRDLLQNQASTQPAATRSTRLPRD